MNKGRENSAVGNKSKVGTSNSYLRLSYIR